MSFVTLPPPVIRARNSDEQKKVSTETRPKDSNTIPPNASHTVRARVNDGKYNIFRVYMLETSMQYLLCPTVLDPFETEWGGWGEGGVRLSVARVNATDYTHRREIIIQFKVYPCHTFSWRFGYFLEECGEGRGALKHLCDYELSVYARMGYVTPLSAASQHHVPLNGEILP